MTHPQRKFSGQVRTSSDRRWSRRMWLPAMILGGLLAFFSAASGPVTPAAEAAATGPAVVKPTARIGWKPCGKGFDCARVNVPLNWARPEGRRIRLGVIRLPAIKPAKRIGSLFINPGGPGSSGIDSVRSLRGAGEIFGDGRFDLVSWDVRGSAGASAGVRCFRNQEVRAKFWRGTTIPTTIVESRAYRRKTAAFTRRCGRRGGPLMRHISSADQARDLDHLRRLVADRRLNFYGFSYGTFLGQTYANMFPGRVRSMVLDSVVNPVTNTHGSASQAANSIKDSDAVLRQFAATCERAGEGLCALAGEGPVMPRIESLLDREAPTPAPSAEPPGPLGRGEVLMALRGLGDSGGWAPLAQQVDEAIGGDGSGLATTARGGYDAFRATAGGDGASALSCADSPARQPSRSWPAVISRLARVSDFAGPFLGWMQWAPCASWPVKSASRYTGPWNKRTANPILVMGNEFDPNLPFSNARQASRRLGNAVLLKQSGYGHGALSNPSPCTGRAFASYLVKLSPPAKQTCPGGVPPFAAAPSP